MKGSLASEIIIIDRGFGGFPTCLRLRLHLLIVVGETVLLGQLPLDHVLKKKKTIPPINFARPDPFISDPKKIPKPSYQGV
jgi:hypothetical protein